MARAILAALLVLAACKKGGAHKGYAGTEGVGKAFADAVSRGDATAAAALFTPDEVVRRALSCKDPKVLESSLGAIAAARDGLAARMKAKPGTVLTFVAAEEAGAQTFVKGTTRNGCEIEEEIVAHTVRFRFDEQRGSEHLGAHAMMARVVHYESAGDFLEDLEDMHP
jgi:hypothetical protein